MAGTLEAYQACFAGTTEASQAYFAGAYQEAFPVCFETFEVQEVPYSWVTAEIVRGVAVHPRMWELDTPEEDPRGELLN